MVSSRFLLVCHDRSGSNLLRSMIGQHPEIYVIPPLPIFEIIYYYLEGYGNLLDDDNWNMLLEDISTLYDANHFPMPVSISLDEIKSRASQIPRNLGSAVQLVFNLIGEKVNCRILGLKFGAYHDMTGSFFEQTNFDSVIFQYRDPRDVALSAWKAGVDQRSSGEFVRHWLDWHRTVRAEIKRMNFRCIEHKYEDLISNPLVIMERIWKFLGVSSSSNEVLEFHQAEPQKLAARTSYMWENLAKPLMADNKEKFYREWGPIKTWYLEHKIGSEGLREYNYCPSRLRDFSFRSLFAMPKRRHRTETDNKFQHRQNHIAESIKQRALRLKERI